MLTNPITFQPATRPWFPVMHRPPLDVGSAPNLLAGSGFTLPPPDTPQTSGSASQLLDPQPSGGNHLHTGYNTIGHSGGAGWHLSGAGGGAPREGMRTSCSSASFCSAGTYSSYQPPPPPLGYIVAYTPEQLTEIIKDQYSSGPPSSLYHCPQGTPARYSSVGPPTYKQNLGRQSSLVSNCLFLFH